MPTNIADNTPNVNPLPSHNFLDTILNLFSAKSTYTSPTQTPPEETGTYNGQTITKSDFDNIRPILFGEISNRAPDKQGLEGNVIASTALNRVVANNQRGNNLSLGNVLSQPNQYQSYNSPQYKLYGNATTTLDLAKKTQVDSIADNMWNQIKSGTFKDITNNAYYYQHDKSGAIQFDSKKPLFSSPQKDLASK